LPHRLRARIHYLTLGIWVLATAHGVLAGSDQTDPWFASLAAASVAAVGLAFGVRFSVRGRAWLTGTA